MFLQLSVSHSVHRGGVPGQVYPPGRYTLLGRYTPRQVHTPVGTPPGVAHAGRCGQQAGGTHPTGMHSCVASDHVFRNSRSWHFCVASNGNKLEIVANQINLNTNLDLARAY